MESCTDNKDDFDCTIFEETFSYLDSGFVTGLSNQTREIRRTQGNSICAVSFTAAIATLSKEADPSYYINAKLFPGPLLRESDDAKLLINVSYPSYIYIYGWFPDYDDQHFVAVWENNGKQMVNDIELPLDIVFPDDVEKDTLSEYFIILAAKKPINHAAKLSRKKFFDILNALSRPDWQMDKISYKIMQEKS
jgi:hypothetical protein